MSGPAESRDHVLDLFAGPGGWDVAARRLGMDPIGIELDPMACATGRAAGHERLCWDVAAVEDLREHWSRVEGLIASPPCQAYSGAGKGAGARDQEHVLRCIAELAAGNDTRAEHRARCEDERSMLVVEPLRWALALEPEWIALEQVRDVLPLWSVIAQILTLRGYQTWTGVLCAADYGVPQTRRRAILMASRSGPVVPPEPTHCEGGGHTLLGELKPWPTMAEALGWGMTERPSVTVMAGSGRQGGPSPLDGGSGARATLRSAQERGAWAWNRPATTVCGDPRIPEPGWRGNPEDYADGNPTRSGDNAIRVTVEEAATLQSFPPDYPWRGNLGQQYLQIGNAVPPLLGEAVLKALVGSRKAQAMEAA